MEQALIYLDQNIISSLSSGTLKITPEDGQLFVYSDEHFREIRRSSDPSLSLDALQDIEAKMLTLQMDSQFKLTGSASVSQEKSVEANFNQFCSNLAEVDCDENLMDPLLAWVNGGGDQESVESMPVEMLKQVNSLLGPLGCTELRAKADDVSVDFADSVEKMMETGNDIGTIRQALGFSCGEAGSLEPETALAKLWEVIGPKSGEMTADQFFGFEPHSWEVESSKLLYLGIVSCCAVLDIVGFQAEKRGRKIAKIPNVRSDAAHIAMGAYCAALISQDVRLVNRAKAIYGYKNIGTIPVLVKQG